MNEQFWEMFKVYLTGSLLVSFGIVSGVTIGLIRFEYKRRKQKRIDAIISKLLGEDDECDDNLQTPGNVKNIIIGYSAGTVLTAGSHNTLLGNPALQNTPVRNDQI